jgi:hypothetical protein
MALPGECPLLSPGDTRDFSIPQNWHIVVGIPTKNVHISCFPELFADPFWLNSSLEDFPSTL